VLFNVLLVLIHPQFTILLAMMTCNLQFELLTASLIKPHTKYLDKSSHRILLNGSARYLYVDYMDFLTISAVRNSNVGVIYLKSIIKPSTILQNLVFFNFLLLF